MQKSDKPSVTVVIPVYNEQERIAASLYEIKDFLSTQNFESDILIIDDGSNDLTTEIVKFVDIYGAEIKSQTTGVLEENIKNVGKGYSIAKGLLMAQGDIIVFTDADSSTPITEITKLLEKLDEGYDVVIGSRNLTNSVVRGRTTLRSFLSRGFNLAARSARLLNVKDSQCGFKAYRREVAREVADKQKTYGFCFDVEHLHIAKKLGYRIAEVPVRWTHEEGSTLSLLNDSITMLVDLLRIRFIHRKL